MAMDSVVFNEEIRLGQANPSLPVPTDDEWEKLAAALQKEPSSNILDIYLTWAEADEIRVRYNYLIAKSDELNQFILSNKPIEEMPPDLKEAVTQSAGEVARMKDQQKALEAALYGDTTKKILELLIAELIRRGEAIDDTRHQTMGAPPSSSTWGARARSSP